MTTVSSPEWVKDAVFYQIFPDRFARSDRVAKPSNLEPWDSPPTPHGFKGGDLIGAMERLDYLAELGINGIYLTPIFQSAANHRYHTHDYYQVDPLLGGNSAFRLFLDRAHTLGIRVMIDGVFNHASRGFFQFNHVLENGSHSPYLDWFTFFQFPPNAYDEASDPGYAAWWNLHALPKFNTDTPAVRDFLLDVGEHWIRFGADAWRLDVPNEIEDDAFWKQFRQRVKAVNPDAYICGEIWGDARRWLQGDQFDAVMNYLFAKIALGFFASSTLDHALIRGVGYHPIHPIRAERTAEGVEALLALYPEAITQVQLNLLGSHDTARALSVAGGDRQAMRLMTLFQMTYPGAPCIYYGDEIGMAGGKEPASRAAFPWEDRAQWDEEMLEFTRRAVALRNAHSALRRGSYRTLHAQGLLYLFERADDAERLVIAFNAGTTTERLRLPYYSGLLLPRFGGDGVLPVTRGHAELTLPPRSGTVWKAEMRG